jgi:hypothetical protein
MGQNDNDLQNTTQKTNEWTLPYLTSVSSHPSKDNHAIWQVKHLISNKNHVLYLQVQHIKY